MAILEDWNFLSGSTTGLTNGTTISVTSATPGTYRNSSGLLVFPSTNTARIDYDGDGNCLGWLMERNTNQRGGSASQVDFTSGWIPQTCLIASDAETGPDGVATSADTMVDLNDSTSDNPYIQGSAIVSSGSRYVMSVFLKKITGNDWVYLQLGNQTSSTGRAWFNLATGALGTTDSGLIRSGIEKYASGWYRCWIALDMTTTTVLMNVALCASDGGTFYNSNGSKIAIRYFQMEEPDYNDDRACYPSSYTTGNRGDDYAQWDDMTWYDQGLNTGNFSWYAEWRHITDSSSIYPWWMGTADAAARMTTGLFSAVAQTMRFWCLNNPGNDGLSESNGTMQTDYTTNYACGSLQTNNQKHCLNAGSIGADVTVDYPMSDTVTQAASYVGCGSTTSAIGGHMRALVFVDDFWDDSTLTDYATNGYTFSTTFPGTVAGDGGHVWPARANDPRWTQIITDSGITASGNFQDDVRAALLALSGASRGSPDDLWKKVKAANGVTDTSEPWLY